MNKKVEEAMNNKYVLLATIFTLAFGGSASSKMILTDEESQVDSLTIELKEVNKQINEVEKKVAAQNIQIGALTDIITRVERDAKERSEQNRVLLEELRKQQSEITYLLRSRAK